MRLGRHFRRAFRRVFRPVERFYHTRVGRLISGINTAGLSEQVHAQNEAARQQERLERERQAQIDKAEKDQQAEINWQRDQNKMQQAIQGTQSGTADRLGTDVNLDFASALTGENDEDEEDILKRMIRNR